MMHLLIGKNNLYQFCINFFNSSEKEVSEWSVKDFSIARLRKYLEQKGWWSTEQDEKLIIAVN